MLGGRGGGAAGSPGALGWGGAGLPALETCPRVSGSPVCWDTPGVSTGPLNGLGHPPPIPENLGQLVTQDLGDSSGVGRAQGP